MPILYRADSRAPDEIFKIGFSPKKAGGIQIQKGGQMIGGVSTSRDMRVALNYAACYEGWVYTVWAEGIDVIAFLMKELIAEGKSVDGRGMGGVINGISQAETACNAIPGTAVIAARQARKIGDACEMFGLIDINLNCTLDSKTQALGTGPLA